MRIGIIGAMESEIQEILKSMTEVRQENRAGGTFFLGKIADKDVVLTVSGIGKVNAAMTTQILISDFGVDAVINTGIAGNLSKSLSIADIVVADYAMYHDFRPNFLYGDYHTDGKFYAHKPLSELAKEVADPDRNLVIGPIASGDDFVEDSALKREIIEKTGAYCVEMEGASIAHVCAKNDIPFTIIRCISDNADEEAAGSFDDMEKITADTSGQMVVRMLERL